MPQLEISIVLVSWNNLAQLQRCLKSLHAQTYRDFETIIVDNGSTDSLLDYQLDQNSGIIVEHLHKNLGFATANNIGFRLARGKWLVLLNTDAFPEPHWLQNLVAAAEANPDVASFSSRQLQANNPEFL